MVRLVAFDELLVGKVLLNYSLYVQHNLNYSKREKSKFVVKSHFDIFVFHLMTLQATATIHKHLSTDSAMTVPVRTIDLPLSH